MLPEKIMKSCSLLQDKFRVANVCEITIDNELKIENKTAIDLLLWRIFFKNASIYEYNGKYPPIKG